ncbi:hypothetical protein PIROE2DRAFT_16565 [Piromyces sp. E2]|nr:hypothetical protein PIROE2DRAFT_16565 [Piromyces sp. E2]|eukprot:OUM58222.1 hypothetical protein PIROE2DRAFT_16565 [Piromyces sp. E2]
MEYKYSKDNDLDIELNMILFSEKNTTAERDSYLSTNDVLLRKKSPDYALYVYDPLYTRRFEPHFVDLKEKLGEEYLDSFSFDASQISIYEDQWVSLKYNKKVPQTWDELIETTEYIIILYSNIKYLKKYNKEVPQTWDELIETAEYILNKERRNNNYNLIGYNGLFPNSENTICSLLEIIYSFRETKESPIPEFNSQTAVDAFNKLKEVKEKISDDITFQSDENLNMNLLYSGNILFSNLWDGMPLADYNMTTLPGKKKGINASCILGYNIGISKYVSNESIDAALEVIKFFTSEEEQKILMNNFRVISFVKNVYNDDEFCNNIYCQFGKNVQGINRPSSDFENYDTYSIKVIHIFYQFLIGNKSVKDALTEIDNITRIHVFTYEYFKTPLIMLILLALSFFMIILSSLLLFIPKFKPYFEFLNIDLSVIYTIGSILILTSGYTYFGEVKEIKSMFNCLTFFSPFEIELIDVENGRNYKRYEKSKIITKLLELNNQITVANDTVISSAEDTQISSFKSDTPSRKTSNSKSFSSKILRYHYSTNITSYHDRSFSVS